MADKKKLSVADILAAARKTDGGDDSPKVEAAPAEKGPPADKPPAAKESAAKPAAAKPAAASGDRPSVSDILAAARGGKSAEKPAPVKKAAAAGKASPKPAAAKPVAAKGSAAAAGPRDTASILAAARKDAKPGPMSKAEAAAQAKAPADAKAKIAVRPMPTKPGYAVPKAAKPQADVSRRGFMFGVLLGSSMAIGFSSLALTFLLWTLGAVRFMFPNVLREPPSQFKVGFPDNFVAGQVETKFKAQFGIWIVNGEYNGQAQLYALKSVCTHLGCTPNWLEAEQKFKCPCHGSGFYKDGINFEGPAPRPLERYAISIGDDGQVTVDKSSTFQEEMGQWADSSSFVAV